MCSDHRGTSGLARLLAAENNVSDLLLYLSDQDAAPWKELVGFEPDKVVREGRVGRNKRSDLTLVKEGRDDVLVEVKVGHELSDEQRDQYERERANRGCDLNLFSLDPSPDVSEPAWTSRQLSAVFDAWGNSESSTARGVARDSAAVFGRWEGIIAAQVAEPWSTGARSWAEIPEVFVRRVLTRELRRRYCNETADQSWAGTTLGGGNPLLQYWREIPESPGLFYVAEVRDGKNLVLRFGVEGSATSLAEREDIWSKAMAMSDVIAPDLLRGRLTAVDPGDVDALLTFKGNGRPSPRGDWDYCVKHGSPLGANPGFHRDGLFRYECSATIDKSRVNGASLSLMLSAALDALASADGSA